MLMIRTATLDEYVPSSQNATTSLGHRRMGILPLVDAFVCSHHSGEGCVSHSWRISSSRLRLIQAMRRKPSMSSASTRCRKCRGDGRPNNRRKAAVGKEVYRLVSRPEQRTLLLLPVKPERQK
jgi:hypothetical protein